jgi:hypothetical protein
VSETDAEFFRPYGFLEALMRLLRLDWQVSEIAYTFVETFFQLGGNVSLVGVWRCHVIPKHITRVM